jgi:hypothetical protein
MKHFSLFVIHCLFFIAFLSGCNHQPLPPDLPPLFPVVIKITQNDAPLAGADVVLMPSEESNQKWACGGMTDAAGALRPKTHGLYDGVPAGKYKVCVSKTEIEAAPPRDETERPVPQKAYRLVDKQYETPEMSPLEIDVVKGKNNFSLDTGKSVRELMPPMMIL